MPEYITEEGNLDYRTWFANMGDAGIYHVLDMAVLERKKAQADPSAGPSAAERTVTPPPTMPQNLYLINNAPAVSGSRYKTGHGNMSAHNFDRARWDVAGKVIRQMHELRQKIEEQDISDIQLKKEYENVFIRALSWAQNLRGWCLQELSHDTNVLLNTMITSMEESEQQSLGEGNQMLQTVKDDLHEIEKRIQSICRMQGVSVTLGNPFVVRVAGTIT